MPAPAEQALVGRAEVNRWKTLRLAKEERKAWRETLKLMA